MIHATATVAEMASAHAAAAIPRQIATPLMTRRWSPQGKTRPSKAVTPYDVVVESVIIEANRNSICQIDIVAGRASRSASTSPDGSKAMEFDPVMPIRRLITCDADQDAGINVKQT